MKLARIDGADHPFNAFLEASVMTTRRFTLHLKYSIVGFLMLTVVPPLSALAQHHQPPSDQKSKMNALIKVVRESTERFKDVAAAEAEGYHLMFVASAGPMRAQWACTS
ncbi:MAG TPA: hypothetical protein VLW55_13500 [Burkholderiaceae bacterium]|nr:hypothetical protein [Burkholderiaceae bacterium]